MCANEAVAAKCEDTSVARSQDVIEFCKNAAAVDAYVKDFQDKHPELPLPEEVQNKLNILSQRGFIGRKLTEPAKLLLDIVTKAEDLLKLDRALTPETQSELDMLSAAIISNLKLMTGKELTSHITRMQAFAGSAKSAALFQDITIKASARTLWEALGPLLYSSDELLDNAKQNADKTTATVKMLGPQIVDAALAKKTAAVDALKTLRQQIDKFTVLLLPRVHVYYAYYGDIRSAASSSRICDATAAVRKACEAELSCTLPDNFTTSLCGYDPAPFIDNRDRGAFIAYDCQIGGEDLWTRNVTTPHGKLMSAGLPHPVLIQSKDMQIACAKVPN